MSFPSAVYWMAKWLSSQIEVWTLMPFSFAFILRLHALSCYPSSSQRRSYFSICFVRAMKISAMSLSVDGASDSNFYLRPWRLPST